MAGTKIIAGLTDALSVASAEKPAARIHVNGYAYVPEEVADALAKALEHYSCGANCDGFAHCRDHGHLNYFGRPSGRSCGGRARNAIAVYRPTPPTDPDA